MPHFIKKLFSRIEKEDFHYSELIKRPKCFADEMCHNFPEIQNLILYLQNEWEAAKQNEESISTYVIDRKDAAGIIIKVGAQDSIDMHHYLLDYLKCQIQDLGYILNSNKHKLDRVSGNTEETWFYFLKPKPTFTEGKLDQQYGNITLELKKDYKNAIQFKFQATYYSGFNYQEPKTFDTLLEVI